MERRHRNIPVFIPHLGCPHQCVFCNQRSISGCLRFDESAVPGQIESALETIPPGCDCQIAFFGGSFTGIDRGLMIRLLELGSRYVQSGQVSSIRLSTRPDLIDREVLEILLRYPVRTVELGIQSTSDTVLEQSGRGHTARDSENACHAVLNARLELVGQMMVGLPGSTAETDRQTACDLAAFGVTGARIYPTVVFAGTPLADLTATGRYMPLTLADAVNRSADAYEILDRHGIRCLRIGLCASEELTDPRCALAGPNHPALGEMVLGEVRFRELLRMIREAGLLGRRVALEVPEAHISQTVGQRRCNLIRLQEEYGTTVVSVTGVRERLVPSVQPAESSEKENICCVSEITGNAGLQILSR